MTATSVRRHPMAIPLLIGGIGLVTMIALHNFLYSYTPSQVAQQVTEFQPDRTYRVVGLVADGSLQAGADGQSVEFLIADGSNSLLVHYAGPTPIWLREDRGVVAEGRIGNDGSFFATEIRLDHWPYVLGAWGITLITLLGLVAIARQRHQLALQDALAAPERTTKGRISVTED